MNGYPTNPNRSQPRRAVTLAEVLIAMGILAIGLLGVAAIFPVGGHYMQSGDIADRGGAIAQAALDDAIVRGYLDPDNWVVHDLNSLETDNADDAPALASRQDRYFMRLLSGDSYRNPNQTIRGGRLGLAQAQAQSGNFTASAFGTTKSPQAYRSTTFGDAYVIDPIGLASALEDEPNLGAVTNIMQAIVHGRFPGFSGGAVYNSPAWRPWDDNTAFWPVRRITTVHTTGKLNFNGTYDLQQPLARELFSAADDLAQHFPTSGDEPVRQRWESWTPGGGEFYPASRQSRGDYSWIISVAPSSAAARDSLATRPDAYPVEVSVVVFHKRTAAIGLQATAEAERLVSARVATAGPSGGELLLTRRTPTTDSPGEPEASPFEDLRAGQYLMVVGPHPLSTESRPILAVRWCRVLNIEDSGKPTLPGGQPTLDRDQQVLVALRGADWPWQPVTNSLGLELGAQFGGTQLSNDLRVAILPGAVAVHTKTMRLESGSEWSID